MHWIPLHQIIHAGLPIMHFFTFIFCVRWGCVMQQEVLMKNNASMESILTIVCPPQLSFVPENFKKFTSFSSQFWLLLSSKLHQKALFYALITKTWVWFCCRGAFLASADNFSKSPLIWLLSPTWVPLPSGSVPDRDWKSSPKASPPTKNFVKKPLNWIFKIMLQCGLMIHV